MKRFIDYYGTTSNRVQFSQEGKNNLNGNYNGSGSESRRNLRDKNQILNGYMVSLPVSVNLAPKNLF